MNYPTHKVCFQTAVPKLRIRSVIHPWRKILTVSTQFRRSD
jgi:hypothetical protein